MFCDDIRKNLINKTVFITGSMKNAGKTTLMNYLLSSIRVETGSIAYMTIGIDGEQKDMIFGTPKPSVKAVKGDFIVTTDQAVLASDGVFEILEVFPFKTKLGTIVLVKVIRDGELELIGPENNTQLSFILNFLKVEREIKTILVDGAVNRITQITSVPNSEFIYVMRVSAGDLMKSINNIKTLSMIKNFSLITEDISSTEECFVCDGALTVIKLNKVPEKFSSVLVNDFTKIFLNWNELTEFLKKKKIFYKERFKLNCIVVNLYDIEQSEFNQILKKNNIKENIIFNPYMELGYLD